MYECDVCGRETPALYIVEIEGAEMAACESCSAGKNVIDIVGEEKKRVNTRPLKKAEEPEEEVISGYGKAIRDARERLGMPLNVLAEIINEKESTMLRVEQERMLPSITLTKKIEKELGIKLTEIPAKGGEVRTSGNGPITLGDAAFKKEQGR